MSNITEIIKILEIIGTIAFAVSGALVAIGASLDIFGVVFIGCITAFGGGIIRDLILGINPPAVFSSYHMCLLAALVSVIVFVISYAQRHKFTSFRQRIEHINNLFDALGLAAFSVIGSEIALTNGFAHNGFLVVMLGMITGIGGGIIRDVLTDTTPYVFKKHVYALASISGSLLYFILRTYIGDSPYVSLAPMLLVIAVRVLAAKYRWSLPKIHYDDKEDTQ